ncbi:uncharacterized protein M6B38_152610 [Iris pallida]|uniref:PWWP domain-containing protein n=1 Tax=Iris pallida TaxID=29817 RepID=A0AAX6F5K6_IRIPA|nr:uncharacterized protein M6B38_152610 [Iris pallida]
METLARIPSQGLPPPEFRAGDFVWAKIKTHLWWPARVAELKAGSFLVSLFLASGGSHLREASQLRPFAEEFGPMSKQTAIQSFASAVKTAAAELAKVAFADFAPVEFLRTVKEAACDLSACDALVAARLSGWVLEFVRETGLVVGSLSELVDAEPVPKGPEIRDGLPSPRRKRKSMAELILVAPKESVSVNLPSMEIGSGGVGEEGIDSPRRERRKSKYLSPPYTLGSGFKRSNSFKEDEEEEEAETLKEGKMSASRKYSTISSDVILSQLLLAASDPLRLRSNRPAKAIWGFFTEFRSSACSADAEFESYLKGLVLSGCIENRIVSSEVVGEPLEAKFGTESNVVKVGGNAEAGLSVGSELRKRGRPKKDRSVGEVLMNLGLHIESRKMEDAANGVPMAGKSRQANGGAPWDIVHDTSRLTELAKSGKKMRSGREGVSGGIQGPKPAGRVSNESEGRVTRQARKKEADVATTPLVEEPKHPFAYVRENLETMISTFTGTSSGIVLAEGLKPEVKENLVREIQGLLNKVNSLQTEITRYS